MEFNEDLEQFIFEYNGLIFAWDEEPEEGYMEQVKIISGNYNTHLNSIVEFMLPDITKVFGKFSPDEIKEKHFRLICDALKISKKRGNHSGHICKKWL